MTSLSSRGDGVARPVHPHTYWSFELIVREQPVHSRMCGVGERVDRRPIDPPPIVQLKITGQDTWEMMDRLQAVSPYIFLAAVLVPADHSATDDGPLQIEFHRRLTIGRTVSSLYLLRDLDDSEGAFFVFPDMSVRADGRYRLRMCLFEMQESGVRYRQSVLTDPFTVYSAKKFPGMHLSCPLACHFAGQGLKIRIRKESRKRSMLTHPELADQDDGVGNPSLPSRRSPQQRRTGDPDDSQDDTTAAASASACPSPSIDRRQSIDDQAMVSVGNASLSSDFGSPSVSLSGTVSQHNAMPATTGSSSSLQETSFMDISDQASSTALAMDTTATPSTYWTLPPMSAFDVENSRNAAPSPLLISQPLAQHSSNPHVSLSSPTSFHAPPQEPWYNMSVHHPSPPPPSQQNAAQRPLSSPGPVFMHPALQPPPPPPPEYQSPVAAAEPPSIQHAQIEWRTERPELILQTAERQPNHLADQQTTVLPSLREQLERIGMVPPSPQATAMLPRRPPPTRWTDADSNDRTA